MTHDTQSVEASNPVLGSLKISGHNVNLIITVGSFVLIAIVAWVLQAHAGDAKETGKEVARELKEANKEMATALRDSNKEVAGALRESNKEMSKVLNELARAIREQNCLAQFITPQDKAKNADLCKRLSQ